MIQWILAKQIPAKQGTGTDPKLISVYKYSPDKSVRGTHCSVRVTILRNDPNTSLGTKHLALIALAMVSTNGTTQH